MPLTGLHAESEYLGEQLPISPWQTTPETLTVVHLYKKRGGSVVCSPHSYLVDDPSWKVQEITWF